MRNANERPNAPAMSDPDPWWQGLTEKQRRFVEAFAANGGNGMDAARQAGYSRPKQEGARVLENAGIQAAIERLRLSQTNAAIATREERQAFWTALLRGEEPCEYRDRLKASELLGKCQGDFLERRELSWPGGVPLLVQVLWGDDDGGD